MMGGKEGKYKIVNERKKAIICKAKGKYKRE